MATKKMDHSEVIERTMEEWSHIFNMVSKAYGIRVTSYKGNQDIVYVPDFVCRIDSFKSHCAVICHKRVFDKFSPTIQINSAIAFLKHPEKYPADYAKVPRNFIKQNSNDVLQRIIDDDDVEALQAFVELLGKNFDLEEFDMILASSVEKVNIRHFAVDLKNKTYSPEKLEKLQTIQEEKDLGLRALTVSDWKKLWIYKKLEDGSLCLTFYKGDDPNLIIPEKIGNSPVSEIGDYLIVPEKKKYDLKYLKKREAIYSVYIPEGIRKIGEEAFNECAELTSVIIPESLIEVGKRAFHGCKGLRDSDGFVIVGNTLYNYYGESAEVTIPEGITRIDDKAFYSCRNLKKVFLPDGLTDIGDAAFYGCVGIETIRIPESLKTVGRKAFFGCKKIADAEGFVIIHHVLFGYYGDESEIFISDNIKRIDDQAFYNHRNIKSVILPDSLESIGNQAFYSCDNLNNIKLSDSLLTIEGGAFGNCRSLINIRLPDSLETIGSNAFDATALTELTVPGATKEIGDSAFFCCRDLERVIFQDGVITIGDSAFYGCNNLAEVVLPDTLSEIGNSVFGSCENLKAISLPQRITKIGARSFYRCKGLTEARCPDSLEIIGEGAFLECWKLKDIYIPEKVENIGKDAINWNVTIHGKPGSYAEQYAIDHHRKFEAY